MVGSAWFSLAEEAMLIRFAVDLVVFVVAKQSEDAKLYGNEIIHTIKTRLPIVRVDLADEKGEAVLITN